MKDFTKLNDDIVIKNEPATCPNCNRDVMPNYHHAYVWTGEENVVFVTASCVSVNCGRPFFWSALKFRHPVTGNGRASYIEAYGNGQIHQFKDPVVRNAQIESLPKRDYYRSFLKIYDQAVRARSLDLNEIAGMGFRKSLEFLLKDYAIYLNDDKQLSIEKQALGDVISSYFKDNLPLTIAASRAAWIGNDETHYLRKWENQGTEDLKKLISITLHWIENAELTKEYETGMPDVKKLPK